MDIRNLLNINAVNEVINDHNLPDYLYSSDLKKLDTFVFNKYNKSLVEYCIVYLDKNNNPLAIYNNGKVVKMLK